jgi:predicted ferric reductase
MAIRSWQAVAVVAALSFASVAATIPADSWATTAGLSLASAAAALSLMAASAVLGSRWRGLEGLFGGLDRVYGAHKWLGIWALAFASVHLAFKAGTPAWAVAPIVELAPAATRLLRQLSFLGLMLIVLLALNRRIRYSVWRWWHKLSGPLFLVAVGHWLSIKSPVALASPAGVWLAAISVLGIAGAGWKLLLYPWLSRHAEYRVVALDRGPDAVRIELLPTGRSLPTAAGQFGFLRLKAEGLREPHPFTIASVGPDGRIGFLVRALGDYTRRLRADIAVGMHAEVHAPFGRFQQRQSAGRQVWIGGGVGISPFVAWLGDSQAADLGQVTLFYFHVPGRDFPAVEVLAAMARTRGAELVPVAGGPDLDAFRDRFGAIVRDAGADAVTIDFCGPAGLLAAVRARMSDCGVAQSALRHELFDFR